MEICVFMLGIHAASIIPPTCIIRPTKQKIHVCLPCVDSLVPEKCLCSEVDLGYLDGSLRVYVRHPRCQYIQPSWIIKPPKDNKQTSARSPSQDISVRLKSNTLWKKCKTSLEYDQKLCQNSFTHFQKFV